MSEPTLNPKFAPFTSFLRDAFTLGETTQQMLCGAAAFDDLFQHRSVYTTNPDRAVWITPFGAAVLTLSPELPARECRIESAGSEEQRKYFALVTPVKDGWFFAELPKGYLGLSTGAKLAPKKGRK